MSGNIYAGWKRWNNYSIIMSYKQRNNQTVIGGGVDVTHKFTPVTV